MQLFKNGKKVATLKSLTDALRYIDRTLKLTQVEAMAKGYQIRNVRGV